MFETIINELNAVENVELGTQISILAVLFHNFVILPLLGGFGTHFGAPRAKFWGN